MRGRMTAAFAIVLTVLTSLVCGSLIWYARFAEERHADGLLQMSANKVRQEVDEEKGAEDAERVLRQETIELSKDGLVVQEADSHALQSARTPVIVDTGMRKLAFSVGRHHIVIGVPWQRIEDQLRAQAAALIALSLFGVLIGTMGAWFLVGRTLSPIAILSAEAGSARVDRLHVRLRPPSSDTEIIHLVTTLNGLLDRLSHAASMQARFYAAASHELRSPLHTLSGHLEVGLSRERSNPEYQEAMEEAYRQTIRLSSLVQDLLLLTRLNTVAPAPAVEPVDIEDVCERALHQLADTIEARRISVESRYAGNAEICAAPNHVEMVVRNLLENAVTYAARGSSVVVATGVTERKMVLDIYNNCAPLAVADARQLLEPFFRPDASRHTETGGNGLGLAICDAIARINVWDLELRMEPHGFRVIVRFPSVLSQKETP